ncbi:TetR/AcrR family transcriptional regulator [Chitinophaga japonensis]|uniref:TetR family transcriptional regulator n=1 Tax=Chitinophaga japonensis TaxID=104662 RepID=A0A562TDK8_CHIJA|nr:TetR/AcrR family transcriptional regulator [Chitinophaga japonensis]TWI91599.1 TetR family transcriptional regulator [Chitinophaga japonensis]
MIAETKDEMRERILEAALKRFTHYGSAKTTMTEIADDLGCSKASLYYYFPDKKGLHKAVLMKIADDFFAEMEAEADHVHSAEECLKRINGIRSNFLQRFCRLELFKVMNETQTEEMQGVMKAAKEREHRLVTRIIRAGAASGELEVDDPEGVALLYNRAMMGLRFSVLDYPPDYADLEREDIQQIMEQQQLLTEIFLKALKRH